MMKPLILIALMSGMVMSADTESTDIQAAKDATLVQTVLRLKGIDVNGTPKLKAAVLRHLKTLEGKPEFVELVKKLNVRGVEDELLRLAVAQPDSTEGVGAAELLLEFKEAERLSEVMLGKDAARAANAVAALGRVGSPQALELIKPLVTDPRHGRAVRSAAAAAVGRNLIGQRFLLERVVAGELPQDATFAVANALLSSPDQEIRQTAGKYLKLPAAAQGVPLPPIAELVKRTGDASRGQQLFKTTATCIKCHKVRGEGKEVGPDLSEIGSKLSKEAMFVSILDPSAGISHNYESYTAILESGNVVTGLVISRTDEQVTLRNAEAIDKTYQMSEVEELIKSSVSIMPADLQKTMTATDLVDVVAFIRSLKKAGS